MIILEGQEKALDLVQKKMNRLSNTRLLLVVITFVFIALGVSDHKAIYFVATAILVVLFVVSLWRFGTLQREQLYLKSKIAVLQRRQDRRQNNWNSFVIDGSEYLTKDTTVQYDIDVFGHASLYQYICVANTNKGKALLAEMLTEETPDFQRLKQRQESVEELLRAEETSLELEIYSHMLGVKNSKKVDGETWFDTFLKYMKSEKPLLPSLVYGLSFVLPILFLASIIGLMLGRVGVQYLLMLFALQCIISYVAGGLKGDISQPIDQFSRNINSYSKFLGTMEEEKFKSAYLRQLQATLVKESGVTKGLAQLKAVDEAFKIKQNMYVHIFLQGMLMWDVHCLRLVERWKRHYGGVVGTWMEVIAEVEAMLSLAVIGQDRAYCYPVFSNGSMPLYSANDLYHPLIQSESVIKNTIHLGAETDVITGSNMSGKTTFLRSIGINLVLAYAGAPVCASAFHVSRMKLFTSMRVTDDISRGISTFYAEVLRIKEMIEYSKSEKPMICLIDEIFKGTNSADRIVGAKAIITGLDLPFAISLVSTHDFELCQLIEDNKVNGKNYHFEEYYEDDTIYFDYKLKKGRCKTTNAKHILRMTGLLSDEVR